MLLFCHTVDLFQYTGLERPLEVADAAEASTALTDTPAISASKNRSIQALDAMVRWWPDNLNWQRQPDATKLMVLYKIKI